MGNAVRFLLQNFTLTMLALWDTPAARDWLLGGRGVDSRQSTRVSDGLAGRTKFSSGGGQAI